MMHLRLSTSLSSLVTDLWSTCRRWYSRSQKARGRLRCLLLLALLASSSGCVGMRDKLLYHHGVDKFVVGHKNHLLAKRAWKRCPQSTCESKYFRQGFLDGYMDVAWGGNGCVPPTAPRKYWSWAYQNADGQCAADDWFAGYPVGAAAAQQEGIGVWGQIPSSRPGDGCINCEPGQEPGTEIYLPEMQPSDVPLEELPPASSQRLDELPYYAPDSTPPQTMTIPPLTPLAPQGLTDDASQAGLNMSDSGNAYSPNRFVLLSDLTEESAPSEPVSRWPRPEPIADYRR